MRDLYAMLFAANLVCVLFEIPGGSALKVAFNGFSAALCFVAWRDCRADDLREKS